MSKQGNSRKPLIIGIIAAVVILAAVLALLLTQCVGGGSGATESTPVQTTGEQIPTYELYWNLDRAEYDGKSEAGMSSRQQESDGYFHIRFFNDGEVVELLAADRKIINAVDVNDLMGLEFDENGIIIGVIPLDDMPVEQVGWQFYVQSVGGKVLKLNSSKAYNGLEVVLNIEEDTGIYDMTGLEGEVGKYITPIMGDRVIALADLGGKLTHVFVYDRPEFMQTFEAECEHCKKTVEWKMWNKENSLPTTDGHYQLQNDISGMSAQQAIKEDQKVCLDLNGKIVDGKENARVYTLHNPNCELAIMDTSEGKTGRLRGHSTASDQGGVVWVRYGAFYLYSGILDASDMVSKLNGTAVEVGVNTKDGVRMISYFYMYGGEIIGGTAKWQRNDKGSYTNGQGGALAVRGKFVMYDGVIRDGKALGVVTEKNADGTPKTYQRGFGGNIYVQSGGEVEIHGGTIKNGTATYSGGNIYIDGTGTVLLNGGVIEGGRVTGKGRNGGNVYVTSKATFTLKSGRVSGGRSYNCAANLYLNGKVVMTGGYIGGGKILTWGTNKVNPTADTANVFSVQGDFYMYGGHVEGSFTCTDTAVDNNPTIIYLTTHAKIYGEEGAQCNDLVLSVGGDNIDCRVGNLRDTSKIGIYTTTGIFSNPTSESNLDSFFSNVDDAEVHYVDGCLALGRLGGCECGVNSDNVEDHIGPCKEGGAKQLFWAPLATTTMPTTTGNYYLPRVMDENGNLVPRTVNVKGQGSMVENSDMKIDLNGGTLLGPENYRVISLHNPGAKLTVCDSSEAKTGTIKSQGKGTTQGNAIWVRYGAFTLYSGTLDGSAYTLHRNWDNAGKDGIYGNGDDVISSRDGGTVAMGSGTTFNMYGGTVIGNKSGSTILSKTVKETVEVDGKEETVSTVYTINSVACNGMSLVLGKDSTFNMYNGVIRDGVTDGGYGGNLYITNTGTVNLYAGTITGGRAEPTYKEDGKTVDRKGWGGNICVTEKGTLNILGKDVLITDGISGGNGGNVYSGNINSTVNMKSGVISNGVSLVDQGGNMFLSGTATLSGGKLIDGKAANGGNLGINSGKEVLLNGIQIIGGKAEKGAGGNLRMSTTNKTGTLTIAEGTRITGGEASNGGNITIQTNNNNKNDPVATVYITGGVIENGVATQYGGNLYLSGSTDEFVTITGGEILNGSSGSEGGNIYVNGSTTLDIKGGLVSGGKSVTGGNIMVPNDSSKTVIKMSGDAVVTDGVAEKNGGNIRVTTGTFNMTGGTISNGVSTDDHGGNLWIGGSVSLTGGQLLNGSAKSGGNITVNGAAAVLSLENVTISGGTAQNDGGNIKIFHSGIKEFNIGQGTVITGGTAKTGGNIYLAVRSADYNKDDTVKNAYSVKATMTGGTITGGTATGNGGNIYMSCGTDSTLEFTMSDGAILGGKASGQGGNIMMDDRAAMTISGGSIEKGTATAGAGNIFVDAKAMLTMSGGIITGGTATAGDGGNLYVSTSGVAAITGGQILDGIALRPASAGGNGGNIRVNGGTVTLENVTVSGGKAGMLAADGVTMDYGAPYPNTKGWGGNIYVSTGTLNIGEGSVIADGTCGGNGGNIYCNATLNITGGTITGGESKFDNGGNVWMGTKANLTVSDGTVSSGSASGKGGNIHANADAVITITGGNITDGSSSKGDKTAVHANVNFEKSQTITIGSVTIDGYVNIAGGSQVKLTGKPVINGAEDGKTNLSLNGNKLDVSELDVGTDTHKIGLSDYSAGVFTGTADAGDKAYFFSDDAEKVVFYLDGEKVLAMGKQYCVCGSTNDQHKLGCDGTVLNWMPWTPNNSLPVSGNYYLMGNVSLGTAQITPTPNGTLRLDLNGWTVSDSANRTISTASAVGSGNVTMWITDTYTGTDRTGTMKLGYTSAYSGQGAIVLVTSNSTLNMIAGTLDASAATITHGDGGGAVCVQGAASVFNLYGGTIIGSAGGNYGGAVSADNRGIFNMYGGKLTGGNAKYGANLAVMENSAANIYGGTIEKGHATNGGNIYTIGALNLLQATTVYGNTTGDILISGGTTAAGGTGGNIEVANLVSGENKYYGSVNMERGTIANGTAGEFNADDTSKSDGWGGNVYLREGTAFTMGADAEIIGGKSTKNGANIYVSGAKVEKETQIHPKSAFTMNGGEISGGNTLDGGGAAFVGGYFTMIDGVITNNSSTKNGGNFFVNGGAVNISGGEISLGSSEYGGNIATTGATTMNVSGNVKIHKGSSTGNGGNIRVNGGIFTVSESAVIENGTSGNCAGNIHVAGSGTLVVNGGKIRGGTDKNGTNGSYSNIYVVNGKLELRGGEIDGAVNVTNYDNDNASIKVSGNPEVASTARNNLTIGYSNKGTKIPTVQIDGALSDDARIGITCTKAEIGVFTTQTDSKYAANFFADDSEKRAVAYDPSYKALTLGKFYCLCGKTDAGATHELGCDKDVKRLWTAWTTENSLPTVNGNYYLVPGLTVTLAAQWQPGANADIALDLNGRTVTCNNRVIALNNAGANLTITDTVGTGKIYKDDKETHTSNAAKMYSGQGGILWINNGSTANLLDVTIDGTGYINGSNGAAVCVEGASALNIYGGTIKGATTTTNGGNVAAKGTSVVRMYNATVEGGKAYSAGGNIYIYESAQVYISDSSIINGVAGKDVGGTANGWGGNIELTSLNNTDTATYASLLQITGDTTISGGSCYGNGGNIRISHANATLEMQNGKILNGTTKGDNGGNIFSTGTLKVTGTEIKDGHAYNGGGNIAMNSSKSIELNNVTVSGGTAEMWEAGNIEIWNSTPQSVTFNNVKILNGTTDRDDKTGANLYIGNLETTVNITDTEIDGDVRIAGAKPTVNLSGKVTITGGETNLRLDGTKLTLKDLHDDSVIGITAGGKGGIFSTPAAENVNYVDNFVSDDPTLLVGYENGMLVLVLGRERCLCGSTNDNHDLGCDKIKHFWSVWNDRESLPTESGYYYLSGDVTLSGQHKMPASVNIYLDLNGRTIQNKENVNMRLFWLDQLDQHLTITDTVGGGTIKNKGTYTQGVLFWVNPGNDANSGITLIKGVLDASEVEASGDSSSFGTAIMLNNKGNYFTMYGGTLLGAKSARGGGAIFGQNWDSQITIHGGTITGLAEETYAAVRSMGDMFIHGGTISGGVETNMKSGTATMTISGGSIDELLITRTNDDQTANNDNDKLTVLNITGKPTNTIKVAVLDDAELVFSGVTDQANASKFVAANAGQTVHYIEEGTNAGKLYICATRCLCGTTHDSTKGYTDPDDKFVGCDGTPKPFMAWTDTSKLPTASGYWYLAENVNYNAQSSIAEGQNIWLDLNGKTVKPKQTNGVDANCRCYSLHNPNITLTISDSVGTGKMISSTERSDQGCVIWVRKEGANAGTFVLLGGELIGNNPNNSGAGGVVNVHNTGSFYMLGGTISGGTTAHANGGGNVYLNSGSKMYMVGGTITDGNATKGGGGNVVVLNGATFTMVGGKIEKGTAANGGNLYIAGTATMNGGEIADGKVYIANGGEFTMNGGEIADGNTNANGANVYVAAGGTFTVNDGTVSDGTAVNGGNVYAEAAVTGDATIPGGSVIMNGGIITGGTATNGNGGNVYVAAGATYTVNGGTISDGKALRTSSAGAYGGNIHSEGTLRILGGTISGGIAAYKNAEGEIVYSTDGKSNGKVGWGGNIRAKGNVEIDKATFIGGNAGGNGGSIYHTDGTMTITDSTVTGGKSWYNNGGNVFSTGSKLTITRGEIKNGIADTGGNISVNTDGELILDGVTISGGNATGAGDNVRMFNKAGTLTIKGGTVIKEPTSKNASDNVNITTASTLNIETCTIDGYVKLDSASATVNVSGKPVIFGGTTNLTYTGLLNIGTMTSGAKIGINRVVGIFTQNTVEAACGNYFVSDNADTGVVYIGEGTDMGKLYMGPVYAECGKTTEHAAHDFCDGKLHTWAIWSSANATVPGTTGYWHLSDKLVVNSFKTLTATTDIALDLKGKILEVDVAASGRAYSTNGSGTNKISILFTNTSTANSSIVIDDTAGSGKDGGDQGRVFWGKGSDKHVAVYNVDFDITKAVVRTDNGSPKNLNGVVFSFETDEGNTSTMSLYDVEIAGGEATASVLHAGKDVEILLHNTTIKNHHNTSTTQNFSGVYLAYATSKLTLSGNSSISGCTIADGSAANITIKEGTLELTDSYVGSTTAPQGIDAPVNTILVTNAKYGTFVADNAAKKVVFTADGMMLTNPAVTHAHCACAGTITSGTELASGEIHICEDIVFEALSADVTTSMTADKSYYLTTNVKWNNQPTGGHSLNICLNGYNLTNNNARVLRIDGGSQANITTCQPTTLDANGIATNNSLVSTGTSGQDGGCILTGGANAKVDIYGVTLNSSAHHLTKDSSGANKHGGALSIGAGTVNLHNSTVLGGTVDCNGGAAIVKATLNVFNSTIKGGTAGNGGTIYLNGGTVNLYSGTITGGTANVRGGNIYVNNGGKVNVIDGAISGGTALLGGNLYYVDDSKYTAELNMRGGTISGGIANKNDSVDSNSGNGGNIWFGRYNVINLSAGIISDGAHNRNGGNIYLSGTLNMSGGTIKDGKLAPSNKNQVSANMAITTTGVLNMTGGIIDGRIATTGSSPSGGAANLSGKSSIVGGNAFTLGTNVPVYIGKLEEGAALRFRIGAAENRTLYAVEGYTITADDLKYISAFYHLSVSGGYQSTEAILTLDTENNCVVISYPTN